LDDLAFGVLVLEGEEAWSGLEMVGVEGAVGWVV